MIDFSDLPKDKQQPNLPLAAVRHVFGTPTGWPGFRALLLSDRDAVRAVTAARPRPTSWRAVPRCCRCSHARRSPWRSSRSAPCRAVPAAGLHGYDYDARPFRQARDRYRCAVSAEVLIPAALPRIDWRASSTSTARHGRSIAGRMA